VIAFAAEPALFAAFLGPAALTAMAGAIVLGIVVMAALASRKSLVARFAVGCKALAILVGWFGAQAPALIPGRYTYLQSASSDAMIVAFLIAALIGAALLVPSLFLLFAVFKGPHRIPGTGQPH
jgi:cytochrome d ubiquinol oxidase subunit II